ncbi:MAG: primosomal protein N' [Methylophaga sp.]|nr:primosomal protein N' [Methylophaga sp.]
MTSILHIAIPCPLRTVFDYLNTDSNITAEIGMRVLVSFRSRQLVGIIVGISTSTFEKYNAKLKTIEKIIDDQVLIPQTTFELINWVSNYYHHPIGECFQAALPKKLRQQDLAELKTETYWQLELNQDEIKLGKKQQQIMSYLANYSDAISQQQIIAELGSCKSSLFSLEDKKLIKQHQQVKQTLLACDTEPSHTLSKQQRDVVGAVWKYHDSFKPYLLHGITGSGKTEVYIQLTKQIIEKGKQALILIPEIGLTTQFVQRFRQHLDANIVVLNSAVSDGDRKQAWLLARDGLADVVIGTRSAVFTPLKNIGLIIIDEEHDGSYKQQDGLRYHARSVALIRAQRADIPIVLGSATPSLESLYNVEQGRYALLNLTERATGAKLPKIKVIDSEGPTANSGISTILYKAIQQQISLGNQVLLFINRRGFAPVLMCHDCNWIASCTSCDAKMIVHQSRNILMCHHCGLIHRLIQHCPTCKTTELKTYGVGTQQLEQTLQLYFPETEVIRIDRDSTQKVNVFAEIIDEIQQGGAKILVGTQMLAKGHDFHNVTLVGVLDADQGLFSADFRATEILAQLITQVTGRAGRGQKPGEVFIQTSQIKNDFWKDLIGQDYNFIAQKILAQRKDMGLPPGGSLCVIRAEDKQQSLAMLFLTEALELLNKANQQQVMILGPVPAIMEKRAGRYRAQLLLSCSKRKPIHQLLDHTINAISKLKLARKVRWSIDIDPVDLM